MASSKNIFEHPKNLFGCTNFHNCRQYVLEAEEGIYNVCEAGHFPVCTICWVKFGGYCPHLLCQKRKRALEHVFCPAYSAMLDAAAFTCPRYKYGCTDDLTFVDMKNHEKFCEYKGVEASKKTGTAEVTTAEVIPESEETPILELTDVVASGSGAKQGDEAESGAETLLMKKLDEEGMDQVAAERDAESSPEMQDLPALEPMSAAAKGREVRDEAKGTEEQLEVKPEIRSVFLDPEMIDVEEEIESDSDNESQVNGGFVGRPKIDLDLGLTSDTVAELRLDAVPQADPMLNLEEPAASDSGKNNSEIEIVTESGDRTEPFKTGVEYERKSAKWAPKLEIIPESMLESGPEAEIPRIDVKPEIKFELGAGPGPQPEPDVESESEMNSVAELKIELDSNAGSSSEPKAGERSRSELELGKDITADVSNTEDDEEAEEHALETKKPEKAHLDGDGCDIV